MVHIGCELVTVLIVTPSPAVTSEWYYTTKVSGPVGSAQIILVEKELWKLFTIGNKAIEEHAPWVKIKEGKKDEALATVALIANILAKASIMLNCIMPSTTKKISEALHFEINTDSYQKLILEKGLLNAFVIEKVPPLFPRVEQPLMDQVPEAKKDEEQLHQKGRVADQFDIGGDRLPQGANTAAPAGCQYDTEHRAQHRGDSDQQNGHRRAAGDCPQRVVKPAEFKTVGQGLVLEIFRVQVDLQPVLRGSVEAAVLDHLCNGVVDGGLERIFVLVERDMRR